MTINIMVIPGQQAAPDLAIQFKNTRSLSINVTNIKALLLGITNFAIFFIPNAKIKINFVSLNSFFFKQLSASTYSAGADLSHFASSFLYLLILLVVYWIHFATSFLILSLSRRVGNVFSMIRKIFFCVLYYIVFITKQKNYYLNQSNKNQS